MPDSAANRGPPPRSQVHAGAKPNLPSARLRDAPLRRFVARTMASLRQLLSAHAPLLLIDAASSRVQVGIANGDSLRWNASDAEAGVAIFQCLEELELDLNAINAFAFCEGPGSVLGIRTAAMALRTWNVLRPRPLFSYCSLALVAHALGREDTAVIADARRDAWHYFKLGGGLCRVGSDELVGSLVIPENFRTWSPLPEGVERVSYDLAELFPRVVDAPLFHESPSPDAFLHEEPSYVTWTPKVHRAPTTP